MSCHVLSFSEVDGFFKSWEAWKVKECGPYASVAKAKPKWCPFSIKEGYYFHCWGLVSGVFFQIQLAEFSYPFWFSSGAKALISKILNPRPNMVSDLDVTCTLMVVTKFQLLPQFSDSRNPS
jgi:hypothetical protein